MINVSLTMEMASDSALFGRDLMFPSRSIRGTYCARDAIAIPLQRRFARDPFVRGVVRGEMANLLTTSLTIRSIWGERFLRRRFSGYLDPLRAADLFRPFLKRFFLTTIDATCHSRGPNRLGAAARLDLGSFLRFSDWWLQLEDTQ